MADKYYRLVCFVVDICADVLRKYFVKLAQTDAGNTYTSVNAYLSHKKRDVMQLLNNKQLRRDQYDLLYPGSGNADENQWDVSILVTLITEFFATRLQPLEIFALKTEIRGIRNELQHYPNTGNISDDDFDDYWGRLDDSVRLIAKNALDPNDEASLLGKINEVKCKNIPNLCGVLCIWYQEKCKQLINSVNEMQANAEETASILRQVTVQKQGSSAMTKNFLKRYQVFSLQVDANVLKTAKEKFKTCKAIVLTGPKECGKTSVAVALASAYESSQCLLLKKPNDANYIDFKNIRLVIIDEFAGKYRYDKNEVCEWYETFDHLYRVVIAGNLNVIITCEKGKLDKCINEIGRHAILDHVVEVPLQTTVVKSEVTERLDYGHVYGPIDTTDHSIGTISDTTQSKNYPPSLSVVPSHAPILLSSHNTIPVSTGNNSLQGLKYVSGQLLDTNPSLGTISNTAQSKNYTTPLSVIPSQEPILLPISTENTSLQGRAQREGIQNPMKLKRVFSGLQSELPTETIDLSLKRSRSMSSDVWSVEEKSEINISTNGDSQDCFIYGSCILPSGEILLADHFNERLKKLDNMYNVKCVCDLPNIPRDVCYVGDNVAVVSLLGKKLQFVDTKHGMTLRRSIDTGHTCHGLACHGDQIYVRDNYGSVYSYSTDGIKQPMIYLSINVPNVDYNITVSNDGSKLYLPCKNELVTIDNYGNHLFTLNNLDIGIPCGVCVDDQGYVYVNGRNGNILQMSEDGRTILQVITNLSDMIDAWTRTLTFDRKNKTLIAAGTSDTIRVFKLRK